jgi:hypothetical protein
MHTHMNQPHKHTPTSTPTHTFTLKKSTNLTCMHRHTHKHTNTHTHTQKHTKTQTNRHTDTYSSANKDQSQWCTHAHAHAHAHTHARKHEQKRAQKYVLLPSTQKHLQRNNKLVTCRAIVFLQRHRCESAHKPTPVQALQTIADETRDKVKRTQTALSCMTIKINKVLRRRKQLNKKRGQRGVKTYQVHATGLCSSNPRTLFAAYR